MTSSSLLPDLFTWGVQVACIAAIGTLLPVLLRLNAPGVRYAYFRGLLIICLVLPWLQGRQIATESVTTGTFTTALIGVPLQTEAVVENSSIPWITLLGIGLLLGVIARGIWMAVGLERLARLRSAGYAVPWQQDHDELQRLLGTRAEIRYVVGLRQPVTFGVRRPLVLLPDSLQTHPLHVQRAVLSHELIHVQHRDWMWLVAEEVVRTLLWFQPGVWWLISRVQLAREEVVDELAMLASGTRRGYIEALAAFADETPLVPAAAFARRRHLFRRMRLISKEADMSSNRIAWSCALMALTLTAGGWYIVNAFPLTGASAQEPLKDVGPLEKQARPITPENPIPRRTYSVDPAYPPEAAGVQANAMVTLMITLDQSGRVAEIRRLGVSPIGRSAAVTPAATPDSQALVSAFDALVRSAADAVRQWTYDPPAEAPLSIRVTFAFFPSGPPRLVAHDGWPLTSPGQTSAAPPPPPPPPPPPSERQTAAPSWVGSGIRIGGNVLAPTKTKHINPVYPAVAQDAGVQGVVIIEALIGVSGKVTNARVLRSVPLLDQAALDAVMLWEFTPTRLNGELVPVIMTVTVQFTLS
jgi:protein TonB